MARLDLLGIEKRFGAIEVLRDVNLAIADGEFIVLVGPSGCGKSTLLRMIAGLEDISAGDFLINGERMNEVAPRHRDIAMVFQSYALYPHMDVARNMGFSMEIRGAEASARTSRVAAAARTLGLDKLTERLPRASRWVAPSCANPGRSCSTSRCPTSTPRLGSRCGWRSPACTSG